MDRNVIAGTASAKGHSSLSARRAWIEIRCDVAVADQLDVALRKESVDRNSCGDTLRPPAIMSLSARRAWIEILKQLLLKTLKASRSPQGERG